MPARERSSDPVILVYEPRPHQARAYADRLRSAGLTRIRVASDEREAAEHLPEAEVLFGWRVPVRLLSSAGRLTWIQSMGAGVDDLCAARHLIPPGVVVTRVVGPFGVPIAEYVFAFLLHHFKGVERMRRAQRDGRWDPFVPGTLRGRRLGVAGLGAIGQAVVRLGRAFHMPVRGLSRSGERADIVDEHFGPDDWEDFAAGLDVLVLTLPLTDETRHIVGDRVLSRLRPGAAVVNVGRGALIREADLIHALESGHLGAAILDVFETEPLPTGHPFWRMSGVYVTPHLSGPSEVDDVTAVFLRNLRAWCDGRPLEGVVDLERQY
ncbi:MAG: D-2-hydroxyacid dehydrogenase [Alicyclobacillus sp.]|nr:D-2-hydroxyacid dehydrogenase [Alicyclobacillus sp.]